MTYALIAVFVMLTALLFLVIKIRFMAEDNKESNEILRKKLKASEEKVTELALEIRDMWDHLPRSLPIDDSMKALAHEIAYRLPYLYATGTLPEGERYEIGELVKKINDPALTELWESGQRKSVVSMLRVILFRPVAPEFTPDTVCAPDGPMKFGLVARQRP